MIPLRTALTIGMLFSGSLVFGQSVPIYNINPGVDGYFVEPANNKTWGYSFYVNSPIRVTHLGWYDTNGDGLSHAHRVGIWKDTTGMTGWPYINGGTLFTSTLIPVGTVAELSGPWRRVAITPITLEIGGYSIGGQNSASSLDEMWYIHFTALTPAVVDPRVTIGSFDYNVSGRDGFFPPGTSPSSWYALDGAEIGAMLFVEPVPEPTTLVLITIAGMLIFGFNKRRQSRA